MSKEIERCFVPTNPDGSIIETPEDHKYEKGSFVWTKIKVRSAWEEITYAHLSKVIALLAGKQYVLELEVNNEEDRGSSVVRKEEDIFDTAEDLKKSIKEANNE